MDGIIVRFEEVGFLKMVGWDRQSWKKPRLIVCCSATYGGGDGGIRFVGTCSYDKRTKHHKGGTRMPHVANKQALLALLLLPCTSMQM